MELQNHALLQPWVAGSLFAMMVIRMKTTQFVLSAMFVVFGVGVMHCGGATATPGGG
jgi:hypothetical protein